MSSLALIVPKMALAVRDTTVMVELICSDKLAAQVLFDDLRESVTSGRGLSLQLKAKEIIQSGERT